PAATLAAITLFSLLAPQSVAVATAGHLCSSLPLYPTQRRTVVGHLCSSSPHLSPASQRQCTTLATAATRRSSLSLTHLPSQRTRAYAAAASSLLPLSLHPLRPLLSVMPSFPYISTTATANC
ncbi:hypothetical protein BHE74_00053644, partial [Ensete ventricosum]